MIIREDTVAVFELHHKELVRRDAMHWKGDRVPQMSPFPFPDQWARCGHDHGLNICVVVVLLLLSIGVVVVVDDNDNYEIISYNTICVQRSTMGQYQKANTFPPTNTWHIRLNLENDLLVLLWSVPMLRKILFSKEGGLIINSWETIDRSTPLPLKKCYTCQIGHQTTLSNPTGALSPHKSHNSTQRTILTSSVSQFNFTILFICIPALGLGS